MQTIVDESLQRKLLMDVPAVNEVDRDEPVPR